MDLNPGDGGGSEDSLLAQRSVGCLYVEQQEKVK
jgi:hypothetical protein